MRIIQPPAYNVYKFDELSPETQAKTLENMIDINLDHPWWDYIIDEDAKHIGLNITTFDIDRGNYCKGEFTQQSKDVANNIIKNHGIQCETYNLANNYLRELKEYSESNIIALENETDDLILCAIQNRHDEALITLADEFLEGLLQCYLVILKKDYKYRISDEAIIETIEANGYEFTIDGKLA